MARSRAFQLTADEACAAPNVMMGMFSLLISLFVLIIAYVYVFVYRIVHSERYIRFGTV